MSHGNFLFRANQRYTVSFFLECTQYALLVANGNDKDESKKHIKGALESKGLRLLAPVVFEAVDNVAILTDRGNGSLQFTPTRDIQSFELDQAIIYGANYAGQANHPLRTWFDSSTGYTFYENGWNAFVSAGARALAFTGDQFAVVIDTDHVVPSASGTPETPNAGPTTLSRVASALGTVQSSDPTRQGNTVIANSIGELPVLGNIIPSMPWWAYLLLGIAGAVGTVYVVEWGATKIRKIAG